MGRKSLIWLGLLAAVLGPLVYALILGAYWLLDQVPKAGSWKAKLFLLVALEVVYVFAVGASLVGALALTSSFWLSRSGRGSSRTSIGRWLLVCVSLLLSLVAAEAASAIWQRQAHRSIAMPIGGFRSEPRSPAQALPTGISIRAPVAVEPTRKFADPAGDREIDLVMVGESSAEGVPFQKWLSIDRIVAWQLQKVIPERPIRLTSLARSGETLEMQHSRFGTSRTAARTPDHLLRPQRVQGAVLVDPNARLLFRRQAAQHFRAFPQGYRGAFPSVWFDRRDG